MTLAGAFTRPDGSAMRRTMGRFLSGVAVVTAEHKGERVGMTISSLTMISLEPPILMISLNLRTRTGEAVLDSGAFAISILGARQEAVARQFAQPGGVRFESGDFDTTDDGLPVIRDALAQAECSISKHERIGDHDVIFGSVRSTRYRDGDPLGFQSGRFGAFLDFHHDPAPWLS